MAAERKNSILAMGDSTSEPHHVHFNQEQELEQEQEHNNDIVVKTGPRGIDIHLGFLQVHHKYEVQLRLSKEILPKSSNIVPVVPEVPNLNCR